jgi:hypothetical protein
MRELRPPAIDYARKVDLGKLPITERQAAFFVDTAQACTQWGKHDKACQAPRAAGSARPPEIRSRQAVRHMVGDLLATAPPTLRSGNVRNGTRPGTRPVFQALFAGQRSVAQLT